MTKEEYQALYEEYWKTDSISRRDEIEEKVDKSAITIFNRVRNIFDRYHARKRLIDDSDYREDRGWIGLAYDGEMAVIEKDSVLLHYGDRWAYGGECDIGIRIYAKWFDPEERQKLAKELRDARIKTLKTEIESIEKNIVRQQDLMKEYRKTVEKLETEEEFVDSIDVETEES